MNPDSVVQVCNPDLTDCQYMAISAISNPVFPPLSTGDALTIFTHIAVLWVTAWVFSKARQAI